MHLAHLAELAASVFAAKGKKKPPNKSQIVFIERNHCFNVRINVGPQQDDFHLLEIKGSHIFVSV